MFDKFNNVEEFYSTEDEQEYYMRKIQEYQELLKIKRDLTKYSKSIISDYSEQKKRKYQGYQYCYNRYFNLIMKDAHLGREKLQACVKQQKQETQDIKQFLKNVDKMVDTKNITCISNCDGQINDDQKGTLQQQYSQKVNHLRCLWQCENKIDRRYRDYWLRQRNDIIQRHTSKRFLD
ncbi:hypothetical protein pb186bvf_015796 [Paramecium bursaria]